MSGRFFVRCLSVGAILALATWSGALSAPIQIENISRAEPVDFEKEILPILRESCLACHNATDAESDLVLETPQAILKGGALGAAAVPGKSMESLLLKMAAHLEEPFMPPPGNNRNARNLTPKELGLIKLWIDQGAKGEVTGRRGPVDWQPLPPGINPIYAVALTQDGQYAACGRSNQIFIYHVPTGALVTRLTDPELQALSPEGLPGIAHRDIVQSLAFHPGGQLLASGGFRVVKLWRRPTNVQSLKLADVGADTVTALAVSGDRKWMATAGADKVIKLWNLADGGKPHKALEGHADAVTGLAFNADATRLYSASLDQTLRLWDVAEGTLVAQRGASAPLSGLALVGEGKLLASGGADQLVHVFQALTGPEPTLAGLPGPLTASVLSNDRKLLAGATADGKIHLIDLAEGKVLAALAGHEGSKVNALAFNGDATRLVSGGEDHLVHVWDLTQKTRLDTLRGPAVPVTAVAVHPSGTEVVSASSDGRIAQWKLDVPAARALAEEPLTSAVAAISADGKLLAIAGTADGKPAILVREVASGNVTKTLVGHEGAILSLAFSPDGQRLASGSADKTARVWNLADGAQAASFAGHDAPVQAVAFNGDGQQVVSGAANNTLKLWNTADAAELKNFEGHGGPIVAVAYAPNNQIVSGSADQTVRVWNATDGAAVRSINHGAVVTTLALSRDAGRLAVAGADNQVKVYKFADGALEHTITGHAAPVVSLSFSPDNARLATAGRDQRVAVWNAAGGAPLETFAVASEAVFALFGPDAASVVLGGVGQKAMAVSVRFQRTLGDHAQAVTRLLYATDGNRVFSASRDGTLRAFDRNNGQQQFAANHEAPVLDLALSPNGQLLASAGENQQVRVWNAANGGAAAKPQLAGFTGPVRSVAFSADSARLAAGAADDGRVIVFQVAEGLAEESFLEHKVAVSTLALLGEKGEQVLSISDDGAGRLWSRAVVARLAGTGQPVTCVAAVPNDPMQVASGGADGNVRFWNLAQGNQVRALNHGAPITAIAIAPNGQRAASAAGNSVKLWNLENNQQVAELKGNVQLQRDVELATRVNNRAKNTLAALKNQLAAAEKDAPAKAEAVKKAEDKLAAAEKDFQDKSAALKKVADDKAAAEKELADAQTAAKAAEDKAKQAKEAAAKDTENKALADAAKAAEEALKAAQQKVEAAQKKVTDLAKPFADAEKAAKDAENVRDSDQRTLELAKADAVKANEFLETTKKQLTTAEAASTDTEAKLKAAQEAATASEKPMLSVAFAPDGSTLAAGSDANLVHLYDATSGAPIDVFVGHQGPVRAVAYASESHLASTGADKSAVVWDLNPDWQLERVIGDPEDGTILPDRVIAVGFSRSGELLAAGSGEPSRSGEVKVFRVEDGSVVCDLPEAHSDTVFGLEFSPDDTMLATCGADKFAKIWEIATGKLVRAFEGHTHHVMDVSWQWNGKVIATAGADNVIKVWNVETGDQIRTIQGFGRQITSLEFVGDSDDVVACSGDKTTRQYRVTNGGQVRNFGNGDDFMFAVASTPNGALVAAGGQDSILRIWNGTNGQVVRTFEPPKPPAEPEAAAEANAAAEN